MKNLNRRKEPRISQKITLQTAVKPPHSDVRTLMKASTYLSKNGKAKIFNVSMAKPDGKKLTYYGTRTGLEILGNVGFMVERR